MFLMFLCFYVFALSLQILSNSNKLFITRSTWWPLTTPSEIDDKFLFYNFSPTFSFSSKMRLCQIKKYSTKTSINSSSFKIHTPCFSELTHLCKNPSANKPDIFKMAAYLKPQVFSSKTIFLLLYRDCPWNYSINHMLKRRKTNQACFEVVRMNLTPQHKFIEDPK